jgi:hypothetical protein
VNQVPPPERVGEPESVRVRVAPPVPVPYVTYTIVGLTGLIFLLQLGSVALLG